VNSGSRADFLLGFAENKPSLPGMIYSVAAGRRADRLDIVTVIFALDWPTERGHPLPASQLRTSTKLQAVASEIYRVKGFLERQLLAQVRLFDVRVGCIRVRYSIEGGAETDQVERALKSLIDKKEFYSVSSASGNVAGRAVNP
jgi:hypothetical protein